MNPLPSKEVQEVAMHPFIMTYLPDFVVKKAEKELDETAENKTICLKELKELIKSNETIRGIDFYDDFLRQFLRRNKHDVPKAFNQLQNFIAMRKKHPHYFQTMTEKNLSKMLSTAWVTFLPQRCPDGCVIVLIRLGNWKFGTSCEDDGWRHLSMLMTESLRDPMTQVCGYKIIYVLKNLTPRVFLHFTPRQAWFYHTTYTYCIPGRYKEFHAVDESSLLKPLWMMFKVFLPQKIKERVYFHSSLEDLLDFFPRSVLPEEYGGDLKNSNVTEWIQRANEQIGESTLGGQPNYF